MKNYYTLLLILLTTVVFSQSKPRKHNPKIEKARMEFIQKELNLETKIASLFWPLYKEHHTQVRSMFKELRKLHKNTNVDQLSEKEATNLLAEITKRERKIESEKTTFKTTMKQFLSSKQILKLKISEKQFRKHLLKKMKHQQKLN